MRTDKMRTKIGGFLSGIEDVPEWAVKYAKDLRNDYEIGRGRPLRKSLIKSWIRTLQAAEKIVLRSAKINSDAGYRFRTAYTANCLGERVDLLKEFLARGRPRDLHLANQVCFLV